MAAQHSGAGDPQRTLRLLWRGRAKAPADGRPARGRRPRLSVDRIVDAALAVADAEGLASMSMARVARELGVGTMSLYTHVPGKAELIDLMADAVMGRRALPGPADPARPQGWRAQVELYAEQTLAVHRRHPWFAEISTVRPPLGPALMAQQEYLLAALRPSGLPARELFDAAHAIVTYVDAAARREVENESAERASGEAHDSWWAARECVWQEYFDPERYPTMNAVWTEGGYDRAEDAGPGAPESADPGAPHTVSRYGLRRLLDGLEQRIATGDRP